MAMIMKRLTRAARAFRFRGYFAVMDGRASSVTVSKALYGDMTRKERQDMHLHVFRAKDSGLYCFAFREDFEHLRTAKTVFTELQYNTEHRKIGFRTDQPTVSGILSDYGMPVDRAVRLSVFPRRTANGEVFYEIQRPRTHNEKTV